MSTPSVTVAVRMDGARLPLRVPANQLGGVGVGRIVFDVVGSDDIERNGELLEDRASLRRRRREGQAGLRAAHISSAGHFRAQSAVTNS